MDWAKFGYKTAHSGGLEPNDIRLHGGTQQASMISKAQTKSSAKYDEPEDEMAKFRVLTLGK